MKTSATLIELAKALVGFHKEVGTIKKDTINPFFKKKYADLSTILDAINIPLVNHGLVITHAPEGAAELTTLLLHTSGEFMESTFSMKLQKDTPQDQGSAISYAKRYAIGAILSLNIDEDDDGNAASGRAATKTTEKPADTKKTLATKPFDEAVVRIIAGERDLFVKLRDNYNLNAKQVAVLQQLEVVKN